MEPLTTISVQKDTKTELKKLKLCDDESYNSLLQRILPLWAVLLRNKLNEEEAKASSPNTQYDNNSNS